MLKLGEVLKAAGVKATPKPNVGKGKGYKGSLAKAEARLAQEPKVEEPKGWADFIAYEGAGTMVRLDRVTVSPTGKAVRLGRIVPTLANVPNSVPNGKVVTKNKKKWSPNPTTKGSNGHTPDYLTKIGREITSAEAKEIKEMKGTYVPGPGRPRG